MSRTYVRRRLVALAAVLVLVGGLSGSVAHGLGLGDQVDLVSSRAYVIRQGDTLWSIASSVAPDRDPREVIHELELINRDASGPLAPGQVLTVPPLG